MAFRDLRSILTSYKPYQWLNRPKISNFNKLKHVCRHFSSDNPHVVQMRGLDYDIIEEDVINFFRPLGIRPKKINLRCDGSGRTASISEVEFNTHAEAVVAMRKKNAFLGNKFIRLTLKSTEITEALQKPETMESPSRTKTALNIETTDTSHAGGHFLRMKNVPWRITDQDIYDFFWPVGAQAVSVNPLYNESGIRTGEFDVQFLSEEHVYKALAKNNAYLGNKFVQLSSKPS